ncbi:ANTAR domain-containing protein [Nocardia uniformis]|uniref:ANTAR domain-containing protein n=1 Tax=Nocardia uniformis TaxID=53432 RepID=A0A849C0U1_9NOCA|nr:ANTAR domain-containing protein [Nocardia uniformis]NNH72234.1 ANTAR domain-containing protein [Nocardia uniformis]
MSTPNSSTTRFLAALGESGDDPRFAVDPARPVRGDRLCAACVRTLPVTDAALTVAMPDGRWEVLGAAGATAAWFADAQAASGEGPGPDAHGSGMPVRVRRFTEALTAGRWPLLAQWSRVDRVDSISSFPLRLGAIRVGFLDLFGSSETPLDVTGYVDAMNIADVITTLLSTALMPPGRTAGLDDDVLVGGVPPIDGVTAVDGVAVDGVALGPWWEQPVSSREIHQATGMIAVQLDCTAAVAYSRLVGHAFASGHALADIAAEVVARRLRFPPEPNGDRESKPGAEPDPVGGT